MNLIKFKYIYLTTLLLITLYGYNEVLAQELEGSPADLSDQGICGTKVIINGPQNLINLRNCSVINGELKIILFDKRYVEDDYSNYTFPELREVTDFVLVYRVHGLRTLAKLFPNLAVIRGRNLFMNYALTIFECKDFQEIGLIGLTNIMRGSIRIQGNPKMCYDRTVDWERITGTNEGHFFLDNGYLDCPGKQSCRGCTDQLCWNSFKCQRLPSPICHKECWDTCNPIDGKCHRCRHYTLDNKCVEKCPADRYILPSTSHCLTAEVCSKMYGKTGWVFGNECVNDCPKGYKIFRGANKTDVTCKPCNRLPCRKDCDGGEINFLTHAEYYKECTHIKGSLQVRLLGVYGTGIMKELESCLGNIEEIGGYLKIHRTLPITSLNFFKNLTRIVGKQLEYNKYSLVVLENSNIQSLFDWNQRKKLTLSNGTVYFQLNPKLCLSEIDKLKKVTNSTTTTDDVSPISNGEKAMCVYIPLKAKSTVIDTKNVTISWERYFPSKADTTFIGYQLYYLEDPEDDVHSYFGSDNCFERQWKSMIIKDVPKYTGKWISRNLTDLKHSIRYAYYVETYHGEQDTHNVTTFARSARTYIEFFTMKSELPPPPSDLRATSYAPDSLTVFWSNDTDYRGNITRYIIEVHIQKDDKHYLDNRNYCRNPLKLYQSTKNYKVYQTQDDPVIDTCHCDVLEKTLNKLFPGKDRKYQVFPKSAVLEDTSEDFALNRTKNRKLAGMFVIPKDFHQPMNRPSVNNVTKNEKFHFYSSGFLSHHQNFTISNLQHFSKYMIFLASCIGPLTSDCGGVAMYVERTLKDENADVIKGLHADSTVYSQGTVRWAEPKFVNGAILTYTVEYKLLDVENSQIDHACTTRLEHEKQGNRFILKDMAAGTYKVRVKATSLAGDGPYSDFFTFTIEERSTDFSLVTVIIMCAAAFGLLLYITIHLVREIDSSRTDEEQLIPSPERSYGAIFNRFQGVRFFGMGSRRQRTEPIEEFDDLTELEEIQS